MATLLTSADPPSAATSSDGSTPAPALSQDHREPAIPSRGRAGPSRALRRLIIPSLALCLIAGLVTLTSIRWDKWAGAASIQTTDNATVRADTTQLSTRVSGNVLRVAVQDFQRVRAGDLLMEIDPADYDAAAAQAAASVAAAQATLENLENQKALQRAAIAQAEAQRLSALAHELQTRLEQVRQDDLLRGGLAGTRQRLEQATADHDTATANRRASEATIEAQRRELDVLSGRQGELKADLLAAQAALRTAQLRQGYTRIVAPFDGVVGQRQVQDGDYVNIGSNLIAVVPLPNVYVIANYKETQLTNVAPGQPVDVTVDTYPGLVLHGRVARLSPASGAMFSLLPPDNATGNFTKVVQRIPVRIEFDSGQPELDRLRPGMSVVTRIRIADDRQSQAPRRIQNAR